MSCAEIHSQKKVFKNLFGILEFWSNLRDQNFSEMQLISCMIDLSKISSLVLVSYRDNYLANAKIGFHDG